VCLCNSGMFVLHMSESFAECAVFFGRFWPSAALDLCPVRRTSRLCASFCWSSAYVDRLKSNRQRFASIACSRLWSSTRGQISWGGL
jgi:hypothetical protein